MDEEFMSRKVTQLINNSFYEKMDNAYIPFEYLLKKIPHNIDVHQIINLFYILNQYDDSHKVLIMKRLADTFYEELNSDNWFEVLKKIKGYAAFSLLYDKIKLYVKKQVLHRIDVENVDKNTKYGRICQNNHYNNIIDRYNITKREWYDIRIPLSRNDFNIY
jgi:hypothetical protein